MGKIFVPTLFCIIFLLNEQTEGTKIGKEFYVPADVFLPTIGEVKRFRTEPIRFGKRATFREPIRFGKRNWPQLDDSEINQQ
uniref:Uncharacterized protein n=1 Tax=Panagrolaimus sp. JU765 TaxID=591449 RepID=A0AC34QHU6_9BILA